ncbi:MAG: nodulation protein NfeD [Candidatus Marinimicrobia bacterium]|nr:nodulation protein NfeD [Candidatus Neomarinimicrobiota bacterium]MBL7022598.1 nodulation protein NfeD [Candidatus Neomarinimicrobiota bacterium]MBL7109867.1 nodulation protein NfeD [Candidatus Neomarinimicrobiota bacterium]
MKLSTILYLLLLFTSLFSQGPIVVRVPIEGTIDMGLPYYIERAIDEAENQNATAIIFDIDTFGGRVDAATQIKDAILDCKIPTIAFINRRAISAGALISLSCDSIFMTSGATIGAATAVDIEGKKASEKVISYMREEMASTAEANGRSRDIAIGMVDEEIEIPFYISTDADTIFAENIEGFKEGKLITLSTKYALLLGVANQELETIQEILTHLELTNAKIVEIAASWSENLVRFLTNPTVAPLLMTLGLLGLLFEVKSPGFGFPGAFGLLCLALFFGSHLLVGLADVFEMLLLITGIILILLEIFVIPGFGIAGIVGGALVIWSLFKMLVGDYPTPNDLKNAYYGLSFGVVVAFFAGIMLFKALTKSKLYQKIIPITSQKKDAGYSISKGYEKLIGNTGVAKTDLRPTGIVIIENEIYQAMSLGDYIEKESSIVVLGIDENQLTVKKT